MDVRGRGHRRVDVGDLPGAVMHETAYENEAPAFQAVLPTTYCSYGLSSLDFRQFPCHPLVIRFQQSMTYVLFFLIAAATGLTARLIPVVVGETTGSAPAVLNRYPLQVFLATWLAVLALLLVVTA